MAEIAPYAFWDLSESSSTATVVSQGDFSITLSLTGSDPFASLPNDWAVFDGSNYLDVLTSTLSASEKEFISPGDGVLIMWHQYYLDSTDNYAPAVTDIMVPFNIGQNTGSSSLCQQRTRLPPSLANGGGSQRMDARIRDGSTLEDTSATTPDNSGEVVKVNEAKVSGLVIDNRNPQKQCYFFRDRFDIGGNVDLSAIGTVTQSGAVNDYIRIGGGINSGGSLQFPYVSRIRNVGIMNLGTAIPLGIDAYLQELFANDGVPTELRP